MGVASFDISDPFGVVRQKETVAYSAHGVHFRYYYLWSGLLHTRFRAFQEVKLNVFSAKERYASGIRNPEGLDFDASGRFYATQHGRDQLHEDWPELYTAQQGFNLPAEEVVIVKEGAWYGWPKCYFDPEQQKMVLAPEFGGDGGKKIGDCDKAEPPIAAFPAHWAPNDLKIYKGSQFPKAYDGGAFIAFHGSWNRAPGPQGGYNIVFQPLADESLPAAT